jgi:hypothetical protein
MSVRSIQGRGLTIQCTGGFVIIDMSGGGLVSGSIVVEVHTGTETAETGDKTMGNESGGNNLGRTEKEIGYYCIVAC